MDEKDLVQKSQEGNEDAYGVLVERYKTKVFNMAYSLTLNREVADDLAQEVFIKAFYALPGFKGKAAFSTWLHQITVNHARDYLRKSSRIKQVPFEETKSEHSGHEDEAEKREREEELAWRKKIVHETIASLPPKYQIILSLRDIQGLPYEEISRVLKISSGTVDSRLHRARKMLKKKIAPFLEKEGGQQ
ncbi:MAG: sigma-70 family RNA polymerase sigma factor [Candidatus Aminicenantes bacterium]|jgi:RNA polymerase sigma-70 factor (ECF subfamily)